MFENLEDYNIILEKIKDKKKLLMTQVIKSIFTLIMCVINICISFSFSMTFVSEENGILLGKAMLFKLMSLTLIC